MATDIARFFNGNKLGCLSLALCFAEAAIVWGDLVLLHLPGQHNLDLIVRVSTNAWLIGGLTSFATAIAAVIAGSNRAFAGFTLAATVMVFFACGLPMLV